MRRVPASHLSSLDLSFGAVAGSILVVEDDILVLKLLREMLSAMGLTVLPAQSGQAACAILARHPGQIAAALISQDVTGKDAQAIAASLAEIDPHFPCVLLGEARAFQPEQFLSALDKPFTLSELRSCLFCLRPGVAA